MAQLGGQQSAPKNSYEFLRERAHSLYGKGLFFLSLSLSLSRVDGRFSSASMSITLINQLNNITHTSDVFKVNNILADCESRKRNRVARVCAERGMSN